MRAVFWLLPLPRRNQQIQPLFGHAEAVLFVAVLALFRSNLPNRHTESAEQPPCRLPRQLHGA